MNTYTFSTHTTEVQRDSVVLSLRKAGFTSSREVDTLRTNASIADIALTYGNALVITTAKEVLP